MKIISWNCNGALRNKFHTLDQLNADILVIQECEYPLESKNVEYVKWANNYLWVGKSKHKGIGIFAKNGIKISLISLDAKSFRISLPFTINDDLKVLAVWTQASESGLFSYIGQMWKYLQLHKNYFKSDTHLIIGDFNSNKIWDTKRSVGNHTHVVNEFKELGISSVYHHIYRCNHGNEIHPTFYMYRKIARPYHIDYASTSETMLKNSNIEIGNPEDWLHFSDHMPITYNFLGSN